MRIKTALLLSATLTANAMLNATPTLIPVVNGQFSVGQWYFQGTKSALGGNLGLAVIPALRFTNQFSLLPTFETNYRGTRSAAELAGGNTLFQDTWENGVGIKAIHGFAENWNLKERAGYQQKWFRETSDENWNDGLYDYRTLTLGGELERHWGKKSAVSFAYDYSFLTFPNYSSLESSQSSDLSREFSGDNVLDAHIQLLSLNTRSPLFWGLSTNAQIYYSPRNYTDQTVVESDGLLASSKRKDTYTGAAAGLERSFRASQHSALIGNLQLGYAKLDSNQNHYDARVTQFIGNFYDYAQTSVGLQFTFAMAQKGASAPMTFELGGSLARRNYSDRVIQSANGAYLSEKLHTTETSVNVGYSYPLSRNLRLRVNSTFGRSKSNNQYESVYRYNYNNSNYQFGFSYDY